MEACAIRVPHEAARWFGGDGDGTGRTGDGDVGGLFEGALMPRSDGIGLAMREGAPTPGLGFCDAGADGATGGSCRASHAVRFPTSISPLHASLLMRTKY